MSGTGYKSTVTPAGSGTGFSTDLWRMWTRYSVRWDFVTALYASVPASESLIDDWLKARQPATKPPQARSMDELAAEVIATLPEQQTEEEAQVEEEKKLLVFQRIDGHLAMRASTVRAHLKECASTLSSYIGKVTGQRSFAVQVKNALYWPAEQQWIPILDQDLQPVTAPTGILERPSHPTGPRGPVSALKAFEYIDNAVMLFPLLVLTTRTGREVIGETDLKSLMMYGGTHGYAGERALDGGRYAFTVTREVPA